MKTKPTINHALKIAVAGGKGGVGKTTVSLAFIQALSQSGYIPQLLDCDVENPNCHLFLDLGDYFKTEVTITVPDLLSGKCIHCGLCSDICQFNALADIKTDLLIFQEMCHGCGGCLRVCPENALAPVAAVVGHVLDRSTTRLKFSYGLLKTGSARTTSVIDAVLEKADCSQLTIIDAAPGTGCASVTGIRSADVVVLVTEPTPFGLHDLDLTVSLMRRMKKPFGVIINRVESQYNSVQKYCHVNGIPLLMQIPFRRDIARAGADGDGILDVCPGYSEAFLDVIYDVQEMVP